MKLPRIPRIPFWNRRLTLVVSVVFLALIGTQAVDSYRQGHSVGSAILISLGMFAVSCVGAAALIAAMWWAMKDKLR